MLIKSLKIENFRNFGCAEIEFDKKHNLFFGENAQGKTNLLEAVFYLSCLKTFRGAREADAIMRDKKSARISALFEAYGREIEVECTLNKAGRRLLVNGIPEKSPRNHIGLIKTVVFSPDDLQLIKEGPALRRRFLNIAISQLRPPYIKALSDYNKIIESKRKILKMEEGQSAYLDYFEVLNENLAMLCAYITAERGKFIKKLEESANAAMAKISGEREELKIVYNYDSSLDKTNERKNVLKILKHLKARRDAEFAAKSCLVGSHKDDFTVLINGISARDFGSQGQIRSAVLALKVAEHEIIERDSGESPILLLDDVLSELDPSRRAFLINDFSRGQTVITGCDPSMFRELLNGKIFTVKSGSIIHSENKR